MIGNDTISRMAMIGLLATALRGVTGGADTQSDSVAVMTTQPSAGIIDVSLYNELAAAGERGRDWLAAQQRPDGSWSDRKFPAVSALALQAFLPARPGEHRDTIRRAVAFLKSCVQPDGGIYVSGRPRRGGSLATYNTAICMMALHALDDPALNGIVLNARDYLARSQPFGVAVETGEFGYNRDAQRAYTDLLNTFYTMEAMRFTRDAETQRPPPQVPADIDWKAIIERIDGLGRAHANDPDADPPFLFAPGQSKRPRQSEHTVPFRSYGSMTYAGLMALIYADAKPDDPRVLSALDWSARHWSLDENPGMGQKGLFFFYYVLTRALNAAGRDLVPTTDGTFVNWRSELATRLVSLQKIDPANGHGYWENPDAAYWEGDPVLVTAYSLLVLQLL